MTYTPGCWFAMNVLAAGSCDGRLRKCHLIPQVIDVIALREAPKGLNA